MTPFKASIFCFTLFILINGHNNLQAAADLSVVEALNDAMKKVTENAAKIQDLNKQEDSLAGYFEDLQNATTEDTVKIAADNIDYPAPLKIAFDSSLDLVFVSADKVFEAATTVEGNIQCANKMQAVKLKWDKIEPAIRKSQELSLTDDKSKVEAYGSVMLSLPLGLAAAELGMSYMMACTY